MLIFFYKSGCCNCFINGFRSDITHVVYVCSKRCDCNDDIMHVIFVEHRGNHVSYNISDLPQALLAELCQSSATESKVVVSFSSNSSVLASFSEPNLSLVLNE